MPRTPLIDLLRRAAGAAAEASTRKIEVERVLDDVARGTSRRDFLGQLSFAALGAAVAPSVFAAKPPSAARVIVVGGGLAGLTCGYRLRKAGITATIYEASSRLGGRCWTRRGDFLEGQIAEHGGELIDTSHRAMRRLARELHLPLENLRAAEPLGSQPAFYFSGAPYSYRQASHDFRTIWPKLSQDLRDAGYPTLYNSFTPRGAQLDNISIAEWINESVPGGADSPFGQLLTTAYTIEYGAECSDQSALNLLYLLGYSNPFRFQIFGASDERYHVRGGNDQVVSRLAARLASQIVTGTALVAVRRASTGAFTLTFQDQSGVFDVSADKVVFALPFSILKSSVDLTNAGFSALKMIAINELPIASNSKLNMQFDRRHWRKLGNNGETYADTGYQATWEVTRHQRGRAGILVAYSGGSATDVFASGTPEAHATQFLVQAEPVLPGLGTFWNGRATLDYWPSNPFSRGSYSYWRVGQYTRFAGIEGVQEGNAHFCGEHTSIDSQGFLNGAVDTGNRAAAEVIADLT